ncbi:MAG: type IV secretory system conjugative DNA transfer family protein, partial [Halobacteriota archaeon]
MPERPFPLGIDKATRRPIYIDDETRTTSLHIIGAPGTGKTKFIEHLVREDIRRGSGVMLIDPHGHLFMSLCRWCEQTGIERRRKILVLDPSAVDFAFSFNPLDYERYAGKGDEEMSVEFMVAAIFRAIAQAWRENDPEKRPRLRRCLESTLVPLVERKLTLLETEQVLDMSEDGKNIREAFARETYNPAVAVMWRQFNAMRDADFMEKFESTGNRLFEVWKAPPIRNIIGQNKRNINFLKLMNEGWVVLVNLNGARRLSGDNARVIGALLVNDLFLAARCRDEKTGKQHPFHVYIDECAEYINEDVARILTEGRKFGLHLTLAHQDLAQLREEGDRVYSAVMGAARTKVVFSVQHPDDAEVVADLIFNGEYDLEEPKRSLDKPFVVDQVRSIFHGGAKGSSSTSTQSVGSQPRSTTTAISPEGEPLQTAETAGDAPSTDGYSDSQSESWSWQEGMESVIEWLHTQHFSLQDQVYR